MNRTAKTIIVIGEILDFVWGSLGILILFAAIKRWNEDGSTAGTWVLTFLGASAVIMGIAGYLRKKAGYRHLRARLSAEQIALYQKTVDRMGGGHEAVASVIFGMGLARAESMSTDALQDLRRNFAQQQQRDTNHSAAVHG